MSPVEREKEVLKEEGKEDSNVEMKQEIASLKQELSELKGILKSLAGNASSAYDNTLKIVENQTNYAKFTTDVLHSDIPFPLSSTGNEGVQTNRQTDILETVNLLRSELKQKFRNLTKQEFRVFSAVYVLEEQGSSSADYPALAAKLGLSETAIRDYIMKLVRKGIPVVKTKLNNKKVILSIRKELKQLATLDNLVRIREPVFSNKIN